MAQIFGRRANWIFPAVIAAGVLSGASVAVLVNWGPHWAFWTRRNVFIPQNVPFSHEHHVREVGIDCRFCHSFVDKGAVAGLPSSETCMKCHRDLFKVAPMLAPVRESYATGKPLTWNRVYRVPDFVYFNHSIHVQKGVACETCHGDVGGMPWMRKAHDTFMTWCLECHRNPGQYVGRENARQTARELTDCVTCHR